MENTHPHLSVVIPVYQAADLIDELVERLIAQLGCLTSSFEILLVEDGSQDPSWEKIEENCFKDPRVQGIKLSRNFGQHSAISAGIDACCGQFVVVMDCDLQDRPEEIPSLYWKAQEGFDIVLAQRKVKESRFRSEFASELFYLILSLLSGIKWDSSVGNFGIYHHTVIDAMRLVKNSIPFFPAVVQWVGFSRVHLPVEHAQRPRGKSSYSFLKKLHLASNVFLFYNERFFKFLSLMGLLFSISSPIALWKSPSVALYFLASGLISVSLGTFGILIGKMVRSVKMAPSYLIQKKIYEAKAPHTV